MTLKQTPMFNSFRIVLAFFTGNIELLKRIPVLYTLYLSATTMVDSIFNTDKRRLQYSKSLRGNKDQDQLDLGNQALAISLVIGSYASIKNDKALQQSMLFSRKDFFKGPDNLLSQCCGLILDKAKELSAELVPFGITPLLIENYEKLMESYSSSVNAPRMSIAERKGAGQQVTGLLKETKKMFKEQIDPLMLLLKDSDPEFYMQYKIRRAVIKPATHKTKVRGILTDEVTGLPLRGVTVTVEGTDIETITDVDGNYILPVPAVKRVPLVFFKEGFVLLKKEAVVRRGKITDLPASLNPL